VEDARGTLVPMIRNSLLRFRALSTIQYRGADGVFLCCDLTNRKSFTQDLPAYKQEIDKFMDGHKNIQMVVLGTKCDLIDKRVVQREELEELAAAWNLPYVEVSSKTDLNIEKAVHTLLETIPPPLKPENNTLTSKSEAEPKNQGILLRLYSWFTGSQVVEK
jgi:GTPase SAR1 family protein